MKRVVTFGEVMMRLTVPDHGRFAQAGAFKAVFGGSESNVSASLSRFGVNAAHVTAFPDNDLGRRAAQSLMALGVDMRHTRFSEGRLGLYFMENGSMFRSPQIIYDRADSSFARLCPDDFDWSTIMERVDWFHWTGITPAISQNTAEACLSAIKAARKAGAVVSGDINYRRNLWQYGKDAREVMPSLIAHCDLIVAGTTDIFNCLDIAESDFDKACEKVVNLYPSIKTITTTIRETYSADHNSLQGVVWSKEGKNESRVFDLPRIVDRVGTGDAYMAGLIYALMHQKDKKSAVEFATASAAYKHSIEGDVNMATVQDIEQLLKGENLGKLLR